MTTTPSDDSRSQLGHARANLTPTYVIGVVFVLVAALFIMASPSDWYGAFKTFHVVFAVIWIGGGFLISALAFIAELEHDLEGRSILARQAAAVSMRVFTPASLVVLVFGIAMMLNDTGQVLWEWSSFWVTFGMLGFIATFVIGFFVSGGANSPEAHAEMNRIFLVARADAAILMLVVVDMVAKPFL
jgi:uncharacterized membrane protein